MHRVLLFLACGLTLWLFLIQTSRLQAQRGCLAPHELSGFLTPEECRNVIRAAKDRGLNRSEVVSKKGNKVSEVRTSEQIFLPHSHEAVEPVIRKVEALLGVNRKYFEDLQVVHYVKGQKYEAHFDSDNTTPLREIRYDTVLIYLNDVPAGGHTDFPTVGRSVSPEQGKAVHWKNVDDEGRLLPCAFHAGLPVEKGDKWICTVWCRLL